MTEKYPALKYKNYSLEKDGTLTVKLNSWQNYRDEVEKFKKYAYIWRGQRCDWPLIPLFYREYDDKNGKLQHLLNDFKKSVPDETGLDSFFQMMRRTKKFEKIFNEYYEIIKPSNDKDKNVNKDKYKEDFIADIYWAIGQHYGLKTPLLDWTEDPFWAAFFAFRKQDPSNNNTYRYVLGLNKKTGRLLHIQEEDKKERYIEFLPGLGSIQEILEEEDSKHEKFKMMFERIKNQKGLFTRTLKKECIERHVSRCYKKFKEKDGDEFILLIKIAILKDNRKDFLEYLEKEKEINYKKMYPDLQGAALHCNLKLESDNFDK